MTNAAYIGGFVLAAYGPHGIAAYCLALAADVNSPESSSLPSLISLTAAWETEVSLTPHASAMAKASAARAVTPPSDEFKYPR